MCAIYCKFTFSCIGAVMNNFFALLMLTTSIYASVQDHSSVNRPRSIECLRPCFSEEQKLDTSSQENNKDEIFCFYVDNTLYVLVLTMVGYSLAEPSCVLQNKENTSGVVRLAFLMLSPPKNDIGKSVSNCWLGMVQKLENVLPKRKLPYFAYPSPLKKQQHPTNHQGRTHRYS
jgi:hypothetical protein